MFSKNVLAGALSLVTALSMTSIGFAADLTGTGIAPGTYLATGFGGGECGRLTVRSTGRHAYVAGKCRGGKMVETTYTARSVSHEKKVGGKTTFYIDRAVFTVNSVKKTSFSGRWVLGNYRQNVTFK